MQLKLWATPSHRFYPHRRTLTSYQYKPLPDASQSPASESFIRLLEVKDVDRGGGDWNGSRDSLRYSLRTFRLSQAPDFQALSYTWGNPLITFSKACKQDSKAPARLQHHSSQHGSNGSTPHIVVDSHSLAVTPNLLSALEMLASRSSPASASRGPRSQAPPLLRGLSSRSRHFWIDAICVDQSNVLERNAQVAIFADVFRAAQSVTIWLGPEDQFTDDALAAVEAISPLMSLTASNTSRDTKRAWDDISYTDFFDESWYSKVAGVAGLRDNITHRQWLGLLALLSRPWFQRAWVVQELAHARQAIVVCGERMVHWNRLAATLSFIRAKRWYHHLCTEKMRHIASLRDDPGVYSEFLASRTIFPTGAFSLMHTRKILRYNALKRSPDPGGELGDRSKSDCVFRQPLPLNSLENSDSPFANRKPSTGSVSLDRLMSVHRDKLATDPRDKVYAYIGLADTKTEVCGSPASSIRPDYDLPVPDVYTRVMALLLLANRDLHLLSHVQDASLTKLEGLPSWVPDFSVLLAPYPLRFRGAVSWSACGNARWQLPNTDDGMKRGILHVQGSKIGVIEETALLQNEADCSAEYWSSIVSLALSLDEKYPQLPNWTTDWRKARPAPQSRLEALWRTLMTDVYSRHTLAPWSDVDFMPHQSHTHAHDIQPRWQDLLRSEPEGLAVYQRRMTTMMESIFQGTYSPMSLAELQHDLEIASGSSRRLFRTENGLLGTGMKSAAKGDEVWVLAGSQVPMILRKRSASGCGNEYSLVGETYVHGVMHRESEVDGSPELQNLTLY